MSREEILKRLSRPADSDASALPEELPSFPEFSDPVDRFREEAETVGTRIYEAADPEALAGVLTRVLKRAGEENLWWSEPDLAIRSRLSGPDVSHSASDLTVSRHPGHRVSLPLELETVTYDRALLAQIGISVGAAGSAVAETGSVIESSRPGGRILPILPPVHMVLVSRRQIRMNASDLFSDLQSADMSSAELLITGPSRTADIEKILILGVHGPRELIFVLTP